LKLDEVLISKIKSSHIFNTTNKSLNSQDTKKRNKVVLNL